MCVLRASRYCTTLGCTFLLSRFVAVVAQTFRRRWRRRSCPILQCINMTGIIRTIWNLIKKSKLYYIPGQSRVQYVSIRRVLILHVYSNVETICAEPLSNCCATTWFGGNYLELVWNDAFSTSEKAITVRSARGYLTRTPLPTREASSNQKRCTERSTV